MKFFDLSPIDRVFLGEGAYPVQFLFYYENNLELETLQSSFERIRHLFWPISCGRLKRENGSVRCYASADQISVDEKVCDEPLPKFDSPKELAAYAIDIDLHDRLAAIKIFQFPKGSLLSVNIAHCLVDGYSYFYFLLLWAATTKYKRNIVAKMWTTLIKRPIHNRSLLSTQLPSKAIPYDEQALRRWIFENTGLSLSSQRQACTLENSQWSMFILTKDQIRESASESFSNPKELGVSWHDLLSAIIWKRTVQDWPSGSDQLMFSSAFDFRRVSHRVNQRYFGNAIRACGIIVEKSAVETENIVSLAKRIRTSIDRIDDQQVDRTLQSLSSLWKTHGEDAAAKMHVADPDCGLLVTNLSRLPTGQLDFGTGSPQAVIPMTPAPRTAVVTSSPEGFCIRVDKIE